MHGAFAGKNVKVLSDRWDDFNTEQKNEGLAMLTDIKAVMVGDTFMVLCSKCHLVQ